MTGVQYKRYEQPVQAVSASQYVSVAQVEQIMGIDAGSMSSLAWLVLQEQARDVGVESIAKNLGASEGDIAALIDNTTGKSAEESTTIWMKGVIALRAVALVNQQNIAGGWDAIEAIAVDKAAQALNAMKGPGDLEKLIQIAATANKAMRRRDGEGSAGTRRFNGTLSPVEPGIGIELRSGNLGTITLTLAPAVRAQLENPARVIDLARKAEVATRTQNLEMLTLKDTRELAEQHAEDSMEINGMIFEVSSE